MSSMRAVRVSIVPSCPSVPVPSVCLPALNDWRYRGGKLPAASITPSAGRHNLKAATPEHHGLISYTFLRASHPLQFSKFVAYPDQACHRDDEEVGYRSSYEAPNRSRNDERNRHVKHFRVVHGNNLFL